MRKFYLSAFILFLLFSSCRNVQHDHRFVNIRGVVFGTYYSVSYYCEEGTDFSESLDSIFEVINQSMSYYQPQSVVSRINRNETNQVDEHFLRVLERSLEIAEETNGAFDPTISPLVNAWGFGFQDRQMMNDARIDSLKKITGYEKVSINGDQINKSIPEIQFDFNAIAKGYASDVAGYFLESKGIETYMVEIGGDLVAKGLKPEGKPWRIGLERPAPDMLSKQDWDYLVEMHDRAVATSGTTRKYYEEGGQRFSHTIDPQTGRPVTHNLLSVSVFANDCMTADAYATAFMVMGLERSKEFLQSRDDLQAFFIYSEGKTDYGTYKTSGLDVIPRSELE